MGFPVNHSSVIYHITKFRKKGEGGSGEMMRSRFHRTLYFFLLFGFWDTDSDSQVLLGLNSEITLGWLRMIIWDAWD